MVDFKKFEEDIFLSTVLIQNLTVGESGTGFFVRKDMGGNKEKRILVSNKHVFWGTENKNRKEVTHTLHLTFHKVDDKGVHNLGQTYSEEIILTRGQDGYAEHDEDAVDVASINLTRLTTLKPMEYRMVDITQWTDFDYGQINAGQQVYFIGYPKGLFDVEHYLPILRSGTIATIPSVDFQNKRQFLIDAQVFPGSSGSPVFAYVGAKIKLIGIISESYLSQLSKIDVVDSATVNKVPAEVLGLGLVRKKEDILAVLAKH